MIVPPPTPNSPQNAPAAVADHRQARQSLRHRRGILGRVPPPTADTLAEALRPLTEDPERAAILLDVDGTLAPIVERAQDAARARADARACWARSRAATALVACISGRGALDARRLVGVGGDRLRGLARRRAARAGRRPSRRCCRRSPTWTERVQRVRGRAATAPDLRRLRVRIEDKGPILALPLARRARRGRGAHADRGRSRARREAAGFITHWGRKVLEVRPPVAGQQGPGGRGARCAAARRAHRRCSRATTRPTSTPSTRSTGCSSEGRLDARVRVGVASDEGPRADRRARRPGRRRHPRASLEVARGCWRAARAFPDFLRTAVLLFGGAATALAVVAIAGAQRRRQHDAALSSPSAGGCSPRPVGLWLGRRPEVDRGLRAPAGRRAHQPDAARASSPGAIVVQPPVGARPVHVAAGVGRLPDAAGAGDRRAAS